jgi:PqqA peptide cyclase
VLQVGFSGGEPLVRRDLHQLVAEAHNAGLYTNLITSGIGFSVGRAKELGDAGLDSVQLSFQSDQAELGDAIAGAPAYQLKLGAAQIAREAGFALSLNFVLHRANIDRLSQMIALAEGLQAERVELANVQYYGWGFLNRATLLPSRQQVEAAAMTAALEKQRLAGKMKIFYVLPDYYESRPKPCMQGWGRRYLTVNPSGRALPCPTATSIPNLVFDSVRDHSLGWIWTESDSFNRFRGTEWMP